MYDICSGSYLLPTHVGQRGHEAPTRLPGNTRQPPRPGTLEHTKAPDLGAQASGQLQPISNSSYPIGGRKDTWKYSLSPNSTEEKIYPDNE